mmetsp:Transcript_22774/g.49570  ORF Transcript_22774/g.49570 Transcript_22774/m.49570 type:complete len:246 (+) Transcript_22774:108-845(+)
MSNSIQPDLLRKSLLYNFDGRQKPDVPGCLPLRRRNHVLERVECLGRRVRIERVHGLEHVVGDRRVHQPSKCVVDIHDRVLRHRRDHAAQGCVDGRVVGQRCHATGIDASDGLVVSLCGRLEGIPIGLGAHHDQLVNCLEALVSRGTRERLQVNVREPVDVLEEGVRLLGERLCSSANFITRGHTGRCTCAGDLVLLHDILEGQEAFVGLLCISTVDQRLHVLRDPGVSDGRDGVVHVHDLGLRH